jgi:outer membrane biosynthesis protein TonB
MRKTFSSGVLVVVRFALASALALLGFGAVHALVDGSDAAVRATTTIPNPDPPPPTTTQRAPNPPPPPPPPPPPQPVAPPPPPQPVAPPPPPPPAASLVPAPQPAQPSVQTPPAKKQKVQHPKKQTTLVSARLSRPRPPNLTGQAASTLESVAVASEATSGADSSLAPLLFGIATGLALLGIAIALTPAWAVPQPVAKVVAEYRENILIGGLTAVLGVGVAFAIVVSGL